MGKVKVGDRVPNFKVKNQDGETIEMKNFLGQPMVIYFYPKDDTPGCTKEACTFRDHYHQFLDAGAMVFGISSDSVVSHKRFRNKYSLPFDLLADENNNIRKAFGVPSDLFGLIPGRVTYIIDNEGVVRHIFNSQINSGKHVEESLKIIGSFNRPYQNSISPSEII